MKLPFVLMLILIGYAFAASSESDLKELLQAHPASATAHAELGNFYLGTEDFRNAAVQFKTALSLDPSDTVLNYNLAFAEERLGLYEEAIRHYEKAIASMTGKIYYRIGLCEHRLGDDATALKNFKEALRGEDHAEIHYAAGLGFASLHHADQALSEFQCAERMDPSFITGKTFFAERSDFENQKLNLKRQTESKMILIFWALIAMIGLSMGILYSKRSKQAIKIAGEEQF